MAFRKVKSSFPSGFLLVYRNDLVDDVHSEIKLLSDDKSLYSIVRGEKETAEDLNRGLERD